MKTLKLTHKLLNNEKDYIEMVIKKPSELKLPKGKMKNLSKIILYGIKI